MVVEPPAGDVDPPREPHVARSSAYSISSRRPETRPACARPARVEADRHHLRIAGRALAAILVEAPPAVVEEVGRARVSLREDVAAVVVRERVRDDEVALALHLGEVRAGRRCRRPRRRRTRLPRRRARACSRSARSGSTSRVGARRTSSRSTRSPTACAGAPPRGRRASARSSASRASTARGRPPGATAPTSGFRSSATAHAKNVTLTSYSSKSRMRRQMPGPAAVLVDGLRAEVAVLGGHDVRDLREPLVAPVAGRLRVLRALLVVDDEVDARPWPRSATRPSAACLP